MNELYARNLISTKEFVDARIFAKSCRRCKTNEYGNTYFREIRKIGNCVKCKLDGKISRRWILVNIKKLVIFLCASETVKLKYKREKEREGGGERKIYIREKFRLQWKTCISSQIEWKN